MTSDVWLGPGRGIKLPIVTVFAATTCGESERAKSKHTGDHQHAARNEQGLPEGIAAAKKDANETKDQTRDPNANPARRKLIVLRRTKAGLNEATTILGGLTGPRINL